MKTKPLILIILSVLATAPVFSLVVNDIDIPVLDSAEHTEQKISAEATLEMAYSEAIGSDNDGYHFQPNGTGYTTRNPDHNLTVDVTADTLTIGINEDTWQLTSNQVANGFTVDDNRLTIHREGYDEWYVNGPVGLQQGFTLYEPSKVAFDVGGTLPTTASAQSLSIGDALNFVGLMAYDVDGDHVPVVFELENDKLVYAYDDAGAVYPLTIDPWVQQAKLLPADGAEDDLFGISVALEGDTALVGAYGDDDSGSASGSAYVFVRSGTIWSEQAKLVAADGTANDNFGAGVALDGDTALVGAPDYFENGIYGSVYVFTRAGTVWSQQTKLLRTSGAIEDNFGSVVALDGDTALVGAHGLHDDFSLTGSAYVFVRNGTTWSQQSTLLAPDGAGGDKFGGSVALNGDTALIGAPGDDDWKGSAYVFIRSGSAWSHQAKLLTADMDASIFGGSVSLEGDTALIGAPLGSGGSAYIFTRSGTMWSEQAKLQPTDVVIGDEFGVSVALEGDTAVVGAYGDNNNGYYSGSAYVFVQSGMTWSQQAKLLASDGSEWDHFGYPVALSGDTVLVGAADDDDNGDRSGSAYVFFNDPLAPPPTATPTFTPTNTPEPITLIALATCVNENLTITISAGDGPFNITASAGINMPVNSVGIGTTTINGPEKWDNLTVTETGGDLEWINLGTFRCRTDERPVPVSPAHRARTTNPFPTFSWTGISIANNYRVWVFDDAVVANRTVDIRENSSGPTMMQLTTPLPDGRLFWRVRGRQNRVWSLWSIRFTVFKDPVAPLTVPTPAPTINLNGASTVEPQPTVVPPTFPAPPNSR